MQGQILIDCVVERKTFSDLLESIHDGRYARQKQKMKLNFSRCICTWPIAALFFCDYVLSVFTSLSFVCACVWLYEIRLG
jgi:hypothetical protein